MTLEDLITVVNERGYLVSNLYQTPENAPGGYPRWQANLVTAAKEYEWGFGATAVEALTAALENTETPGSSLAAHKAAAAPGIDDLLDDTPAPAAEDLLA